MIVSGLPQVKVELVSAGQPLHEYEDPNTKDDETTATRYVQAIQGLPFEIHCNSNTATFSSDLETAFRVDGNRMVGAFTRLGFPMSFSCEGHHVTKDILKPFVFGSLSIDEDGGSDDSHDERGCIVVEVHECKLGQTSKAEQEDFNELDLSTAMSRQQAAKHGTLHVVEFGMHKQIKGVEYWQESRRTRKLSTYKFYYRSKTELQSLRILAQEPQSSDNGSVKLAHIGDQEINDSDNMQIDPQNDASSSTASQPVAPCSYPELESREHEEHLQNLPFRRKQPEPHD
ncbi:hypothetical protein AMS68_002492 [Peltaster fructicola]|uniref:DUF7918 domain-containing protein n=1 Tax=Peltaster fructicola TaxID=286661 RepID=A0A6H0XQR5_9PEZI|nr:hypothetical protein AMS68_002492 [Peltaster fructicola]